MHTRNSGNMGYAAFPYGRGEVVGKPFLIAEEYSGKKSAVIALQSFPYYALKIFRVSSDKAEGVEACFFCYFYLRNRVCLKENAFRVVIVPLAEIRVVSEGGKASLEGNLVAYAYVAVGCIKGEGYGGIIRFS